MKSKAFIISLFILSLLFTFCSQSDFQEIKNECTLLSPNNGDIFYSNNIEFKWESNTGAELYYIYLDDSKIAETSSTNYILPIDYELSEGFHTWYIKSFNNFQKKPSQKVTFASVIPEAPQLQFPQNNECVFNNPIFSWKSKNKAIPSEIELSINSDFTDIISKQSSDNTISMNLTNDLYYWRIKTLYPNNAMYSDIRKIIIPDNIKTPIPITFEYNENKTDLTFSWDGDKLSGIYSYEFELSNDNFQTKILSKNNISDSTITLNSSDLQLKYDEYQWRVRIKCDECYGDWSYNGFSKTDPCYAWNIQKNNFNVDATIDIGSTYKNLIFNLSNLNNVHHYTINLSNANNLYIDNASINQVIDNIHSGITMYEVRAISLVSGCEDIVKTGSITSNGVKWQWDNISGGNLDDKLLDVYIDSSNNLYMTGFFRSSSFSIGSNTAMNAGSETADIFVAKLDANNNYLWSYSCGGDQDDFSYGIAVNEYTGNSYITGYFESQTINFGGGNINNLGTAGSDIFLVKLNNIGAYSKEYVAGGTNNDLAQAIDIDLYGNLVISGYEYSTEVDFGSGILTNQGCQDVYAVKLSENLDYISHYLAGGTTCDYLFGQSVDVYGNVFISGAFFSDTINFGGGDKAKTGSYDIYAVGLDNNLNYKWDYVVGGTEQDVVTVSTTDAQGNIYLAGYYTSNDINFGGGIRPYKAERDIFVVKLDANGQYIWDYTATGSDDDRIYGITVSKTGYIYLSGYYKSNDIDFGGGIRENMGSYDLFVVKLDANGHYTSDFTTGGDGLDIAYDVNVDNTENVYLSGWYDSTSIDLGGGTRTNSGGTDTFIVKINM